MQTRLYLCCVATAVAVLFAVDGAVGEDAVEQRGLFFGSGQSEAAAAAAAKASQSLLNYNGYPSGLGGLGGLGGYIPGGYIGSPGLSLQDSSAQAEASALANSQSIQSNGLYPGGSSSFSQQSASAMAHAKTNGLQINGGYPYIPLPPIITPPAPVPYPIPQLPRLVPKVRCRYVKQCRIVWEPAYEEQLPIAVGSDPATWGTQYPGY